MSTAKVVICGAGFAGVSAAFHLSVRRGMGDVVLVDEREPLSLTSDKGTQAYRNWWAGPAEAARPMVAFLNRSIDLFEDVSRESGHAFRLNRRGYAFFTARADRIPELERTSVEVCGLGAGFLRRHPGPEPYVPSPGEGFEGVPTGADLVLDPELIRRHFPYVAPDVAALLHVRRCGWMDSRAWGRLLLGRAESAGLRVLRDRVVGVDESGGRVSGVRLASGATLDADAFVICAGPLLKDVGRLVGADLPVFNELHAKMTFADRLGLIPEGAPFLIWTDPVRLPWTEDERSEIAARPGGAELLRELPGGVHVRTRGRDLVAIWTYDISVQEPVWPPTFDPHYGEVLLRGLSRMVPAFSAYLGEAGQGLVDGGYYCKTRENRALIGPLPMPGAYVFGAVSGYGLMSAMAGGELLAAHVVGDALPSYAPAFRLERYDDPEYQRLLASADPRAGQM